jgi:hypothetical protein
MNKKINSKDGEMSLVVLSYENNNRMAIICINDDEPFGDITINLSDMPINDISEGFLNADINRSGFDIIPILKELGIISMSYGFIPYNMGTYEYVKFDLEKLKEYDSTGIEYIIEHKKPINENDVIRTLLDNSYFMQPVERLTYRMLQHYAFVLNENPSQISDAEIQKARDYAKEYLKNNDMPSDINEEIELFINKERFLAITNIDYDSIKDTIKEDFSTVFDNDCYDNDVYFDEDNDIIVKQTDKIGSVMYCYDLEERDITLITKRYSDDELTLLGSFVTYKKINI